MAEELLTYDEIAERLGISKNAARVLVQRRDWVRTLGDGGRTRVRVPVEAFKEARAVRSSAHAQRNEVVLVELRARLEDKDREIGRLEAELKRAHADVDHAWSEVARAREETDRERQRVSGTIMQIPLRAGLIDQTEHNHPLQKESPAPFPRCREEKKPLQSEELSDDWWPIETAPRDGTVILVAYSDGTVAPAQWVSVELHSPQEGQMRLIRGGFWGVALVTPPVNLEPTHWTSMPASPPDTAHQRMRDAAILRALRRT